MDDDERRYGDYDCQMEMAEDREAQRRARWYPTASDPYPYDYWNEDGEPECEPEPEPEPETEDA